MIADQILTVLPIRARRDRREADIYAVIAVQVNNLFYMIRTTSIIGLIISLILLGCTEPDQHEEYDIFNIKTEEIVLSPATHEEITIPSLIRTAPDRFLVFDGNLQKIFVFNYQMEQILTFGNSGRGPGETQAVTNIWIRDDHYMLYDYNGGKVVRYDFEGMFLDEHPVDVSELAAHVELLELNKLVLSANGEQGMQLKISDLIKPDHTEYIGEAVAGPDEISNEEIRSLIRRGRIPNWMKNSLLTGSNEEAIYSFQNAMLVLQKYNLEGELLWEIDINIPSAEEIFENYLEINREQNFIFPLMYAYDMHVLEFGAAILLRTIENKPASVLWIPDDGKNIQLIEYPGVNRPDDALSIFRFRISPEQKSIFFINSSEGEVTRSIWPIEYEMSGM